MSFRHGFFVVLFAVLLQNSIEAAEICKPDEYPWIGDGCISGSSFKAIFISGIVFACLSFALLIVLLALFIWKKVLGGSSGSDYSGSDDESSRSVSRTSSIASETRKPEPVARPQAPPPQAAPAPVTAPKPQTRSKPKPKPAEDDDYSSQF